MGWLNSHAARLGKLALPTRPRFWGKNEGAARVFLQNRGQRARTNIRVRVEMVCIETLRPYFDDENARKMTGQNDRTKCLDNQVHVVFPTI